MAEPAIDDSQEVHKMQKTCETRETRQKKTHAQNNAKIDFVRFII